MDELVRVILKKYNLEFERIHPVQKGYRNKSFLVDLKDGSRINLIIYKREPGILYKIESAHNLANQLKEYIPVRYPLKPILKIKENLYACVYNYLPGSTIPWEGYTMDLLKLLGENLNKIHYYSRSNAEKVKFTSEAENLKSILDRVHNYFKDEKVMQAVQTKLVLKLNFLHYIDKFKTIVDTANSINEPRLLHMDFVRGNILFQEDPSKKGSFISIFGILDFEKASYGSPLFDIARTLAFLIVDCKYKSEEEIRKYFLKSGYIKRGKHKQSSFKHLSELVLIYLIYDFYKFLKHNPYEFLKENEHFLRTKDILLKSKLVTLL